MSGIDAYNQNAVVTQSPGGTIVLLYEGAIRFCRKAIDALEAKDYETKGNCINKAVDIINELNISLEMEVGGDIAENLRALYGFMVRHLREANMKKDPEKIREVIRLLEELNEGWKVITD